MNMVGLNSFEQCVAAAASHYDAGRLMQAEDAYREALGLAPQHPGALHNLGVVLAGRGAHPEALASFDAAVKAAPHYASAHYSRGVALETLGRPRDAIAAYRQAVALDPGYYDAHRAVAFCLLAEGDRDRALDHFARTYELRRGEDRCGIAARSLTETNRIKLNHDAAQFRYLAEKSRNGRAFEKLARDYEAVADTLPDGVTELTEAQRERLGEHYNAAIHLVAAPELAEGAIAARQDSEALVRRFRETGAVWFDELLTSRALEALRRCLLESTVWHDFTHVDGFVAAYLEDGLASPLLLQIADELRRALPEVLGPHRLTQAWAFKAVSPDGAIGVHADAAAVSVNFWLTPDEANNRPGTGGMGISLASTEQDRRLIDRRNERDSSVPFLEHTDAKMLRVPYAVNRATLFESLMAHFSVSPEFKKTYIYHRINLTMLFGKAVQSRSHRRSLS